MKRCNYCGKLIWSWQSAMTRNWLFTTKHRDYEIDAPLHIPCFNRIAIDVWYEANDPRLTKQEMDETLRAYSQPIPTDEPKWFH